MDLGETDPYPEGGARRRIILASALMIASLAASRVMGLVRMKVFSSAYGADPVTDAYVMAFALPDFVFVLVGGGVIASAFVPYFTECRQRGDEAAGWRSFNALVCVVGGVLTVLLGVLWVAAPWVAPLLLGELPPEVRDLSIRIMRVVLFSQVAFFFGGISMGALNAKQHFLAPALGPILYNLFIIVGIVCFAPTTGIMAAAWAALVGAVASSVAMQVVARRRHGARFAWVPDWRDAGLRRVIAFMAPVILGLCAVYVEILVSKWLATRDPRPGATTCFENAYRLAMVPVGVFAVGAGVAAFPTLADSAARGAIGAYVSQLSLALRSILFLTIPSTAIIAVLALPIVRVIFEGGEFTPEDSHLTATILMWFSIGVIGLAGQQFFPRAFYALNDPKTPFLIGAASVALHLALALALFPVMGVSGCALAMSVASIAAFGAMLFELRRRLGLIDGRRVAQSLTKVVVASLIAAAATFGSWWVLAAPAGVVRLEGRLWPALAPILVGAVCYTALVPVLRMEEGMGFLRALGRRLGRNEAT